MLDRLRECNSNQTGMHIKNQNTTKDKSKCLPFKSIQTDIVIQDSLAMITMKQEYVNPLYI